MNNFAVTIAWILAALFLGTAVLGFVPNPLLGQNALFVTNTPHDLVHLASAVGFIIVAVLGEKASVWFMQVFGVFQHIDWLNRIHDTWTAIRRSFVKHHPH